MRYRTKAHRAALATAAGTLLLVALSACRDTTAPASLPDGGRVPTITDVMGAYRLVAIDSSPMPAVFVLGDTTYQWIAGNMLINEVGWAVATGVAVYLPSSQPSVFVSATNNGYWNILEGRYHLTGYSDTVAVTVLDGHMYLSARLGGRRFLWMHQ